MNEAETAAPPIPCKKGKMSLGRKLFILGMIFVPLVNFLVFYVYVNFNSILMGFQLLQGDKLIWSVENFSMLFRQLGDSNSILVQSLGNTMLFFAVSLFVILPLTTLIAYFIYKKILLSSFFRVIFFLPSILSAVVLTILYTNILDLNGPVTAIVQKLFGLENPPEFFADSRYAIWAIVGYVVWTGFGTNLILLGGAMSRIPESVVEAGTLDGVSPMRELFSVILPLVWPTMTTLIIFAFVGIFTASGPILLFTMGDWNTYTLSYWIFEQVYYGGGRPEYASAVGLFFTVIALPIVFFIRRFLNKTCESIEY